MAKTLREYVDEERGRASALADAIGIDRGTVTKLAKGELNASADLLLKIETATGGAVTAAAMLATRAQRPA